MLEYDKLSNNAVYAESLDNINYDISKKTRLAGMITGYYLLIFDRQRGIDALKNWGIEVKNNRSSDLKFVESQIKALKTNIAIDEMSKKTTNGEEKADFNKLIVRIENALNRNIDEENLTVSKWIALENSIKIRNEEIKKLTKNAR